MVRPRAEEGVVVRSRAQLSMLLDLSDRLADVATKVAAGVSWLRLLATDCGKVVQLPV